MKRYDYVLARKYMGRTTSDVLGDTSVLGDGSGKRQSTAGMCLNYAGYASAFKFRLKDR